MSTKSEELFERAQKLIPGGVNSPVRAFRAVGRTPFFVERRRGRICMMRMETVIWTMSAPGGL